MADKIAWVNASSANPSHVPRAARNHGDHAGEIRSSDMVFVADAMGIVDGRRGVNVKMHDNGPGRRFLW